MSTEDVLVPGWPPPKGYSNGRIGTGRVLQVPCTSPPAPSDSPTKFWASVGRPPLIFSRTIIYTVEDSGLDYIEGCVTVEATAPSGYYPDSRSNLRAQLKRRELGVVVVGGVNLVLEPVT